jgi:hypothetical protein
MRVTFPGTARPVHLATTQAARVRSTTVLGRWRLMRWVPQRASAPSVDRKWALRYGLRLGSRAAEFGVQYHLVRTPHKSSTACRLCAAPPPPPVHQRIPSGGYPHPGISPIGRRSMTTISAQELPRRPVPGHFPGTLWVTRASQASRVGTVRGPSPPMSPTYVIR